MCGVAGAIALDQNPILNLEQHLTVMSELLSHRGPDGRGAWKSSDDKVGYAAPLDVWLRGPLKEWGHEKLFYGPITELPDYERNGLKRLWDGHQAGTQESSWPLWRWISLNEWFCLIRENAWKAGSPETPREQTCAF